MRGRFLVQRLLSDNDNNEITSNRLARGERREEPFVMCKVHDDMARTIYRRKIGRVDPNRHSINFLENARKTKYIVIYALRLSF